MNKKKPFEDPCCLSPWHWKNSQISHLILVDSLVAKWMTLKASKEEREDLAPKERSPKHHLVCVFAAVLWTRSSHPRMLKYIEWLNKKLKLWLIVLPCLLLYSIVSCIRDFQLCNFHTWYGSSLSAQSLMYRSFSKLTFFNRVRENSFLNTFYTRQE